MATPYRTIRDVSPSVEQQNRANREFDRRILPDLNNPPPPTSPKPIGGHAPIQQIEGLGALITDVHALVREVGNLAKEAKIVNERQVQMNGQRGSALPGSPASGSSADQKALVESLKQAITQTQDDVVASAGKHRALTPTPPGRTVSDASTGKAEDTEQMRGEAPLGSTKTSAELAKEHSAANVAAYDRNRNYFKGSDGKFSVANLRQDFGTKLSDKLDNFSIGEQLVRGENGELRHAPAEGEEIGEIASPGQQASFLRREKMAASVRGGAQALSEGATMREAGMGMLPGAAAKAAGVVGGLYTVGKMAGDLATSQRAKNNEWIAMQGGGQTDAFEERARGQGFKLSQFGTLTGEDADALYKGVAKTGMDRGQRGNAQDFAVNAYKDLGVSITESVEMVQFASTHGQASLVGLADALKNVTTSAEEAGVNTETARKQFEENWKAFSETFGGEGATSLSAGLTAATTGLGKDYESVGTSGVLGPDQLRIIAARNNMTLGEVVAMGTGPNGAENILQMSQEVLSTTANEQFGAKGRNIIRKAQAAKGGEDFTEEEIMSLGKRVYKNSDVDPEALIMAVEQMTGYSDLDYQTAMGLAIQSTTGQFQPAKEAKEQKKDRKQKGLTHENDIEGPPTSGFMATVGSAQSKVGGALGSIASYVPNQYEKVTDKLGWDHVSNAFGWLGDQSYDAGYSLSGAGSPSGLYDDGVQQAFVEDAQKTNRSGGISQILSKGGDRAGIEKIQVETADGPRIVSLEEGMKYFRDQIDSGTATVSGGDLDTQNLAEVLKVTGDKSLLDTPEEQAAGSAQDTSLTGIGKEGTDLGAESLVTVRPTPELMKWLDFITTGKPLVDINDVLGPGNPHRTTSSR